MQISLNWLRDFIDLEVSPQALAHTLTMGGLEVEAIEKVETVRGGLKGVVIAEVLGCTRHPDADRLSVCRVDIGAEEAVQIVCGAPNVAAGQKVAVATVGATLYPVEGEPLTIKKGKIRGQESLGMICAEDELGLGTSHEGILVLNTQLPNGTPLANLLDTGEDWVFTIGLTPNRTDAMSHYGVARDLGAILNLKPKPYGSTKRLNLSDGNIPVSVVDPGRCLRYAGCVIRGVKVGPSPDWLRRRLEAVGQRPINNVVDVTNYILHGLGQPLHAFDLSAIQGGQIIVRTARAGEELLTLDGKTRTLSAEDLVIANADAPMCIAGVMGGLNSGTTDTTTDLFLESACFSPDSVRRTVKRTGIHSDSAFRFERGTDPQMVIPALETAVSLILEIAGGSASEIIDIMEDDFQKFEVNFNYESARRLIGEPLTNGLMDAILHRLEIDIEPLGANEARLLVPRYRTDVRRQADVAEEILRVYGFNNVAAAEKLNATPSVERDETGYYFQERVADHLSVLGFREAMNNSLIPKNFSHSLSVDMLNPLSEENAVLRDTLLYGGLESIAFNQHRQQEDVRLFEFGRVYARTEENFQETRMLALFVAGAREPLGWEQKPRHSTIFTLRSALEQLQGWAGISGKFTPLAEGDSELAYGLQWSVGKKLLGRLGKVKSVLTKKFDIRDEVFFAAVDWDALLALRNRADVEYQPVPRFPAVFRDLSLEIEPEVTFAHIEQTLRSANPKLVREIQLFDVYDKLEGRRRSYALRVQLQAEDKTLEEVAVEKTLQRMVEMLEKDGRVRLRR